MTCKTNERFALNTRKTKQFFEQHNIVALKAKRDKNPEVDPFLAEIGNTGLGIPYYAVFTPGKEGSLQFDGIFFSSNAMIEKIRPAIPGTGGTSPGPVAAR
jgi:thiol:disulfide interchange protein